MNMYVTKNPSTKGPGMELPECDNPIAIKKFLKQLHFEVNTLLGSQIESAKTVSENVATLINLVKDLKGSYAEFEKAKTAKKDAEKELNHASRRKHVSAEECHVAVAKKTTTDIEFQTQLAKMYGLVIDYVDCRSQLLFAIDGDTNYQIPEPIPVLSIEELFVTEAAKVA